MELSPPKVQTDRPAGKHLSPQTPLPTSLPSPKGKPPLNPSSREPSYIDDAAETKIFPSTQLQTQFARGNGLRAKSYRAVSWPRPSCPGASSVVDQRLTSASTSFPSTAVRRLLPTHPCPRLDYAVVSRGTPWLPRPHLTSRPSSSSHCAYTGFLHTQYLAVIENPQTLAIPAASDGESHHQA